MACFPEGGSHAFLSFAAASALMFGCEREPTDGYCSFAMAVDVARLVLDRARVKIGEINPSVPVTLGDTLVHVSEFDHLVRSTEAPIYFPRWSVDDVFDRVTAHVAAVIEDGSCLAFSIGPF